MICNICKFKVGCVFKPKGNECGLFQRIIARPINQHNIKITGAIYETKRQG